MPSHVAAGSHPLVDRRRSNCCRTVRGRRFAGRRNAQKAWTVAQPDRPHTEYVLVTKAADIERAKTEGQFGIILHFQGTTPIEDNSIWSTRSRQVGVGMIQLSYNVKNRVGDGCEERTDAGLSRFGHRLIERMNQQRVIVDCSHTGYPRRWTRSKLRALQLSSRTPERRRKKQPSESERRPDQGRRGDRRTRWRGRLSRLRQQRSDNRRSTSSSTTSSTCADLVGHRSRRTRHRLLRRPVSGRRAGFDGRSVYAADRFGHMATGELSASTLLLPCGNRNAPGFPESDQTTPRTWILRRRHKEDSWVATGCAFSVRSGVNSEGLQCADGRPAKAARNCFGSRHSGRLGGDSGKRRIVRFNAGVANIATAEPVRDSTIFPIGSITKLFTTCLILQLVEHGRLSLDRPY